MNDLLAWAVLAAAGFGAGVLNAMAGGGTFLTFPALVWAGVPPIPANATSALAVCPGYFGSVAGFRRELAATPGAVLQREMLVSAAGGVIGALLLLVTPARVFAGIVPWLLLLATVLFALGPRLARRSAGAGGSLARWRLPGLLLVTTYGGYFNGGVGILLLALYLVAGESRLNTANALKNLNSAVLSVLSVAAFALGGFAGARLARRLPTAWVRAIVIAVGLVMSAVFFARA